MGTRMASGGSVEFTLERSHHSVDTSPYGLSTCYGPGTVLSIHFLIYSSP